MLMYIYIYIYIRQMSLIQEYESYLKGPEYQKMVFILKMGLFRY